MFKCEACGKSSKEFNLVPSSYRDVVYEIRDKWGNVVKTTSGTEIVSEMKICSECLGKNKQFSQPRMKHYDCNNCTTGKCSGDFTFRGRRINPIKVGIHGCLPYRWNPAQSKVKLVESAINHPQSLHEVASLTELDFNIKQYFPDKVR